MRVFSLTIMLFGAVIICGAGTILAGRSNTPVLTNDDLIRMVKILADSGQADNPAKIAATLHVSLSRRDHVDTPQGDPPYLYCQPGAHWIVDNYDVSAASWRHGESPRITLEIVGMEGCGKPILKEDGVILAIGENPTVLDIGSSPAVACISEAEITGVVPSTKHPNPPAPGSVGVIGPPDGLFYSPAPHVMVEFDMANVAKLGEMPVLCLSDILFTAQYPLGPLHELDLKN